VDPAPERPPYEAYAAIAGSFAGLLATAGALARLLDRDPQCQTALDFAVLGAATFKAARTLTHDRVTSPIRAPFVEGEADAEHEEPVRKGGLPQAMGELVTCTRCVGTWAAAGLAATQIIAPRFGRLLTWSLGAAAANDFLQAGFTALSGRPNEFR
jgi:crotonobetainyl-CoA:carnitine CoA-transferase CaiB-like acyl-CoA transferase